MYCAFNLALLRFSPLKKKKNAQPKLTALQQTPVLPLKGLLLIYFSPCS